RKGPPRPSAWSPRGVGTDPVSFCTTMAGVQAVHGDELGATAPTGEGIQTKLTVVGELDRAIPCKCRIGTAASASAMPVRHHPGPAAREIARLLHGMGNAAGPSRGSHARHEEPD